MNRNHGISEWLESMSPSANSIEEVRSFFRLPYGYALLDANGAVLQANAVARAIFENSPEINIANGEPRVACGAAELKQLISGATPPQRKSFVTRVERGPRRKPVFVLGLPERDTAGVILLIGDPEIRLEPNTGVLRSLFGLTPAECAVATELISGKGASDLTRELKISSHTARSHIKKLLQKTGTKRQCELVHLLLSCPGLACASEENGYNIGKTGASAAAAHRAITVQ